MMCICVACVCIGVCVCVYAFPMMNGNNPHLHHFHVRFWQLKAIYMLAQNTHTRADRKCADHRLNNPIKCTRIKCALNVEMLDIFVMVYAVRYTVCHLYYSVLSATLQSAQRVSHVVYSYCGGSAIQYTSSGNSSDDDNDKHHSKLFYERLANNAHQMPSTNIKHLYCDNKTVSNTHTQRSIQHRYCLCGWHIVGQRPIY